MTNIFKTFQRYRLLQAILYIVMGIFLLTNPNGFFKGIIYLLSGYFIFFGLIGIIQNKDDSFKNLPPASIGFIVIGLAILVFVTPLLKLMNIVLGIFIALNGITKIKENEYCLRNFYCFKWHNKNQRRL